MADKDFFLSPDDSQTLGDINYMRKSVRVRRTFPKTLKNKDGFAIEKEVSSDRAQDNSSFNGYSAANSNGNGFANSQTDEIKTNQPTETNNTAERRQVDTNLDMFRNMARNIRKR